MLSIVQNYYKLLWFNLILGLYTLKCKHSKFNNLQQSKCQMMIYEFLFHVCGRRELSLLVMFFIVVFILRAQLKSLKNGLKQYTKEECIKEALKNSQCILHRCPLGHFMSSVLIHHRILVKLSKVKWHFIQSLKLRLLIRE